MRAIRYFIPWLPIEIPIAILAVGAGFGCAAEPSFEGNVFLAGCLVFLLFNLLFAPALCWNFRLCLDHLAWSRVKYGLLSSVPLLLLSALYLEKYFGLWITILLCGIYFIVNAAILAVTKSPLRRWGIFLPVFAVQMGFFFLLCLSI